MKVRQHNRLLVSGFCATILAGIVLFVNHIFNDAKRSAALSTIASITAGIQEMDDASWKALGPTSDWRVLPPESVDALLDGFYRNGRLDVGPSRGTAEWSRVDPWGRRYHVLIRTVDGGRDALVWSGGRDGRSGTPDDILLREEDAVPAAFRE